MPTIFGFEAQDLTFDTVLRLRAERNGDRTFLTFLEDGRKYSYRDIDLLSNRIANGLLANGVGKGTHVAVLMENCPELILTYFALGKIGAVAVPLNPAARGAFLEYYLSHSDCVAIVIADHLIEQLRDIRDSIPRIAKAFVLRPSNAPAFSERLSETCSAIDLAELLLFPESRAGIEVHFSDVAAIMYTSGTTGPSKGNLFTQAHTLTFGIGTRRGWGFRPDDVEYVSTPLFHAAAWNAFVLGALLDNGEIALVRRFSVTRFWPDIRASGATVTTLIAVSHFLMAPPESPDDRTHRLRLFVAGPMPRNPDAFKARFGVELTTGFGISDYGNLCALAPKDVARKPGSCGRPIEGVRIRVVDNDDFDLPPGQVGELVVRNEMPWASSSGYYKMPEQTAESRRNLWFHTGDRGYLDEEGFFYFRDRKKDALRRRGENISAFELESAISQHPAIKEAAVFAIRAEGTDDEVGLSVILHDGQTLKHEELIDYCAKILPYFVIPRYVEYVQDFPRTPTLKVQKFKLREAMQENLARVWDREKAGIIFGREGRRDTVKTS
jgi:crotonobetaine/carnitine-CoA ligase